jgi:broad specificity phosphatase PhoE
VIFIRHGQLIANAAGTESEEEHASIRWLDAPMTALGRSQANSWAGVAATWGVEEVWCSPLSRAMESACRIFQDCEVPIHVTPHAREGWWHCTENRGRLAHAIAAGTDGSSDERRWPALAELPGAHKLRGLERLAAPTQDVWDPAEEERMMGDEQALFDRWKASIAELKLELSRSPAHRIALVCHWGIIEALTSIDVENCTVVPTVSIASDQTCHFQLCPPTMTHPPLGTHACARGSAGLAFVRVSSTAASHSALHPRCSTRGVRPRAHLLRANPLRAALQAFAHTRR